MTIGNRLYAIIILLFCESFFMQSSVPYYKKCDADTFKMGYADIIVKLPTCANVYKSHYEEGVMWLIQFEDSVVISVQFGYNAILATFPTDNIISDVRTLSDSFRSRQSVRQNDSGKLEYFRKDEYNNDHLQVSYSNVTTDKLQIYDEVLNTLVMVYSHPDTKRVSALEQIIQARQNTWEKLPPLDKVIISFFKLADYRNWPMFMNRLKQRQ